MDIPNLIAASIRHSVLEVFTTMLSVNLDPGEVLAEAPSPEPTEGVVSFIGLAGAWAGTGTIMCSAAVACRICSQMLMAEAQSVNEDVLDAIAELTNIVVGSVKNDLEQHLGPLGLSIPTVVFGRNFKTKSSAHAEWVVERFRWDGEDFLVKICLAPTEKPHQPHPIGHTCPLDVKV
jgi:chemotaxis protein CheX